MWNVEVEVEEGLGMGREGKFYYLFCRNQSGRDLSEREWTAKMMMLFFGLN